MSKRNFNNFAEQTENVANETTPVEDYVEDVLNTPAEESVPATVKPVETPAVEIKKIEPKVEVKPEPKTVKVQRGTVRC